MEANRLEAFSDGVIAIMVLEMKVPHGAELAALAPLAPVFLSYVLSFAYLGIYWNNHHHMLKLTERIDGSVLWANLHLLFWLSLLPFTTGWMGENHFGRWPTVLYGVNLLCCAIAYYVLQIRIIRRQGTDGLLARAVATGSEGQDLPGAVRLRHRPRVACVGLGGPCVFRPRRLDVARAGPPARADHWPAGPSPEPAVAQAFSVAQEQP